MSNAQMAAEFIQAFSKSRWPNDAVRMETGTADYLHSFADIASSGSHKYIPADKLSKDIGAEEGSGVYGYMMFRDGSYLLKTCCHGVAVWEGGDDDVAYVPTRK